MGSTFVLGVSSINVRHIHASTLFGAIVGATFVVTAASTAMAAGPQLPPAEFRQLPVGTELDYDKFSCVARRGKGFASICVDVESGPIRHFGLFQLVGDFPKNRHIATVAPLDCPERFNYRPFSVRRIDLKPQAREALKSLWPLEVGKEATYTVSTRYHNARTETQDPVTVRVTGTKEITVGGINHRTYVVEQDVDRSVICVASYKRTFWFDPALGVNVKERIQATGRRRLKAKTSDLTLVDITIPASQETVGRLADAPTRRAVGSVSAASPTIAPGTYVPPPKGTVIEYDTWTCTVRSSDASETLCRDDDGNSVRLYRGLLPIGKQTDNPHYGHLSPIFCAWQGRVNRIEQINMSDEQRAKLDNLWPLKGGNQVDAEWRYRADEHTPTVTATIRVHDPENINVGGDTRNAFRVSERGKYTCQTNEAGTGTETYDRTWWLDSDQGLVLKEQFDWISGYRKGKSFSYELVSATYPANAPTIAKSSPPASPIGATTPQTKPPAQTAVAVDLDKQGPVIEVTPLLETDTPVVAIEGRVTDTSRIVLVQFNGQPVPMESDGTISVTRAVPPGSSSFTIVAYDEWGNAGQQVVTVTHKSGSSKSVASAVETPKSATTAAVDSAAPVIELPEAMTTTNKTVSLTGRINDSSKVIEVTVEGRPVAVGADGSFALKRAVSVGTNTIRIAAIDEWGNKAEKQISVERRRPFADINFGTYHAIVIGNNDYASMKKAHVEKAEMDNVDLSGADLSGANLEDASLNQADLSGANLANADLKFSKFQGANLKGVSLKGVDLSVADTRGSLIANRVDSLPEDIQAALKEQQQWSDSGGVRGARADLSGLDLRDTDFTGMSLSGAKISGAKLAGASFMQSLMMFVDLSDSDLEGADFSLADMRGIGLGSARLHSARLRRGDLRSMPIRDHHGQPTGRTWASKLKGADLTGADLTDADLRGADFSSAILTDTKLTRVDLQSTNLDGANIQDAVLVDAVLPERV